MKNFTSLIAEARIPIDPELKHERDKLKRRIKEWKAKGKDATQLEAELQVILDKIAAMQSATAAQSSASAPVSPTTTPKPRKKTTKTTRASKPTAKPSGAGDDWNEGYKAAVEAIKQQLQQQGGESGDNSGGGEGMDLPNDPEEQAGDSASGSSGSGSGKQSRDGKQSGEGVVRPEDCMDPSNSLDKIPGRAGGMIDKSTGDQLAKSEGYEPMGGSEEGVAKNWEERAKRAATQMRGKNAGYDKLKAKLDDIYRTTKDWKKELKKIVGHAISPDDKRSAFANKNILISQNRIARTDKDKYDNVDYMMAWIDTSGSMSQEYLEQCLQEVYQVALAKKPLKLVIFQFDTRVTDVQEFNSVQELKKSMRGYKLKGGGGTEVKPCFDMLAKDPKYSRRACELVMIFTDGWLDQYKRDPRRMKNLVWVVVDNVGFELQYKDMNTKCVRLKSSEFYK